MISPESGNIVRSNELEHKISADVVIVGGGPAGIYLADVMNRKVGSRGSVLLLEQQREFGGCAPASLQQFRTMQGHPSLVNLVGDTVQWYQELSSELHLGKEDLIERFPYIFLARDEDQLRKHTSNLAGVNQAGFGKGAEIINSSDIKKRFPFIDGELAGALYYPDAGRLDFDKVITHITKNSPNATFALETAMKKVIITKEEVSGVETNNGFISTRNVVLCPGPFLLSAPDQVIEGKLLLNGDMNSIIQVRKRQRFAAAVNGLPAGTNVYIISPEGAYVRLRTDKSGKGEGIYGYADPDDPQLGPHNIVTKPKANELEFPAIVYDALSRSISSYGDEPKASQPNLAVRPVGRIAGYYVDTPDDRPIISKTAVKGLYILSAFSHMGVMAGHGAAKRMGDIITDSKTDPNPFSLDRTYTGGEGIKL